MIIDCPTKCGKKVIAQTDGRAYLCRACWSQLFSTLLQVIRPAKESTLTVVQPIIEEKSIS
jgi:hypothetical protein